MRAGDPIAAILPGTPLSVAGAVLSCLAEHLGDYLDGLDPTRIMVRNGPTAPLEIFYGGPPDPAEEGRLDEV